jgi:hypothetical protein
MEEVTAANECQELKNLKYKTMLLNGVPLKEIKSSNDLSNLDKFLENEKNNNVNEPWCKLNKTVKTKKIQEYVEIYKGQNNLNDEESDLLFSFLKDCIDRKKLQRVKDVIYDKENGTIKEIPALCYVKTSRHFTLKNIDKRVSTLKSLAPKKNGQGTIRKKEVVKHDLADSEEDDEN